MELGEHLLFTPDQIDLVISATKAGGCDEIELAGKRYFVSRHTVPFGGANEITFEDGEGKVTRFHMEWYPQEGEEGVRVTFRGRTDATLFEALANAV